jgi:hypothetical protein
MVYGPSHDADPADVASYRHRIKVQNHLRMVKEVKMKEIALENAVKRRTMGRREKAMEKKRELLEWHLEFEDFCRTQGFFDARGREKVSPEEQATREAWAMYQLQELASSARSIRNLMPAFNDEQ